jgi:hypothetical protein
MREKNSKEEKEANTLILKVLSDIATEEQNKEDTLAATKNDLNGHAISAGSSVKHPGYSTSATSEGSPAADPAPTASTSKGSSAPDRLLAPVVATLEGSPAPALLTQKALLLLQTQKVSCYCCWSIS